MKLVDLPPTNSMSLETKIRAKPLYFVFEIEYEKWEKTIKKFFSFTTEIENLCRHVHQRMSQENI